MKRRTEGVCRFCFKTLGARAMGDHLLKCEAKQQKDKEALAGGKKPVRIYHLRVWSHAPFFLDLEMAATTTLAQLDGFLRDIWLECCGHLSQFSIDGVDYSQDDDSVWGPKPKSMKTALNKVLRVGDSFDYEYDFGSTTELAGVVLAERQGVSAEPIAILARNNPPEAECSVCKKKAEVVCPCCEQCFCESCFGKDAHFDECDEWEPLPLVNSPRAGVCGYTGNPSADPFTVPA